MITTRDLAPERQERMREFIRSQGGARVEEITQKFNISAATARRDLESLENHGHVRRVHGGAVSSESRLDEPLFDDKTSMAAAEKRAIAQRAVGEIQTGDVIYLDGGSTVLEVARLLRDRTDITVVTNSLRAVVELSGNGPDVIMIGGALRRRSQTMVGSLTRLMLSQIHVDVAFMGTIGLTPEDGPTTTDASEAYTKELVMSHAAKVVLLADQSKIGKTSFAQAGRLEDIQLIITDLNGTDPRLSTYRKRGIQVVSTNEKES